MSAPPVRLQVLIAVIAACVAAPAPARASESAAARGGAMVDSMNAGQLVRKSIAYHDPDGDWWTRAITMRVRSPRVSGAPRLSVFTLHSDYSRFELAMELEGDRAEASRERDTCSVSFNGGDWNEAATRRFGALDCARLRRWHDYYAYLFNVPMNLLDAGAALDPVVRAREFLGREVFAVRITYGEGQPVWFHFFDPVTFATVGCSFSTGGEEKDGEYIRYEGEVTAEAGRARLPGMRSWFMHADGKHLGDDVLEAFEMGANR